MKLSQLLQLTELSIDVDISIIVYLLIYINIANYKLLYSSISYRLVCIDNLLIDWSLLLFSLLLFLSPHAHDLLDTNFHK